MRDFAELLKAVAWPSVALTALLLLRSQAGSVVSELAAKIRRAKNLTIGGKAGLSLAEEIIRGNILPDNTTTTAAQDLPAEFEQLAAKYDDIGINDLAERVAARHRLADRLGRLAITLKLPRGALSEALSEGKLVALATMAVLKPMAGDLTAIKRASETAKFNFTRYRLVLALVPTLSKTVVGAETLDRAEVILHTIEDRADATTDPSLQRLIDKTRLMVSALRDTLA